MDIKKSEFIISAVNKSQYPKDGRPEIAFVGRSNVGKSSLINTVTNRRKLAKTSSTPGKTRLINYFLINDSVYFVDLPGYGYARVSKKEQMSWGKMIEGYLTESENLKKVILLVDCRHKPTKDDVMMYSWIKHFGVEVVIVGTKSDKLSKNQLFKSDKIIRETLQLQSDDEIIYFSSLNKSGKDKLINTIFKF